jgi:hydroxymethylglutaryl-CoA reductase (NADPH)
MFGFLTSRWQGPGTAERRGPSWFDRSCTPVLLSIAKKACTHPIHTIVVIAFLASYSYLGVLEKGLLEGTDKAPGHVDFQTLLAGSKRLRVGEETSWKWEVEEDRIGTKVEQVRPPA